MHLPSVLTAAVLVAAAHAHPGHNIDEEMAARRDFLLSHSNNLNHCAEKQRAGGMRQRAIERRAGLATKLVKSPDLQGNRAVKRRVTGKLC